MNEKAGCSSQLQDFASQNALIVCLKPDNVAQCQSDAL